MTRNSWRTAKFAVTTAVLAVLLSGCGSIVPGWSRVATPDLSGLDTGELRTSPGEVPPNDNDTHGRVIESARMSEAVISPPAIDPALAYGGSVLLPTPGRTAVISPEIALKPVARYGLIAGYAVSGTDDAGTGNGPRIGQSKALRLTVLSFREDAIARTVATGIDAADAARNKDTVSLGIPGYKDALSHWRPQIPVLVTTLAYKSYVIVAYVADRTPDPAALTGLTTAALTAELPLLDSFKPTPPDKLSALPFDSDNMLRRLIHPDPNAWPYPVAASDGTPSTATWFTLAHGSGVVYGPQGATQLFGRTPQAQASKTTSEDKVERVAFVGDWWLLRLSDAVRTRKMHLRTVAKSTGENDLVTPPEGIADAACFKARNSPDNERETRYFCYILDGRYWSIVSASDEKTVRQRAAAEYALLVNSR